MTAEECITAECFRFEGMLVLEVYCCAWLHEQVMKGASQNRLFCRIPSCIHFSGAVRIACVKTFV
jgi:hypothetical protein